MVHFLFALSLFFFWSCIGSFCGVLMETEIKRSFWTGRSQCLSCKKTLRWFELIPVLSYFLQRWRCRRCGSMIPPWIISIETLNGLAWMFFWSMFYLHGYSFGLIAIHLVIITMFLMLALEDIKTFTIPDRLSVPSIGLTGLIIIAMHSVEIPGLLLPLREALIGGIIGMLFYMLQMMIPGILSLLRKKQFSDVLWVLFLPFVFPFWLVIKTFFGEKRTDRWIPTVQKMDQLPTWVGGGDVRLGIFLGLIVGPVYFWWVIGIGYVLGTLFWLFSRVIQKRDFDVLPVAPLLFLGFCATWLIQIFS